MNNKYPAISVTIPTLNNARLLDGFFERILKQDYPKEKIEIVVTDGGSSDGSIEIAKEYGARVFNNTKILAEPGITLAMSKASGDIITILAADNYLSDTSSFKKIAKTFEKEDIFAAFPVHENTKEDSIYTKYINTFTDPFNHFVYGYAANGRTFKKVYKTIESNSVYDVYDFRSSEELPMIAFAQGFSIRSDYKRTSHSMDDIKPVMDLIDKGKKIAFIHSFPLYHHSVKDLGHFIRKQRWGTRNAITNKNYGISYRMKSLSPLQEFKMKIWPFYALSFFIPLIYSIYHLIKDKQKMWIYHAPLCFISAVSSVYEVLVYNTFNKQIVSRQ